MPDSWLRGFLQVQSAAALPRDTFALAPIDLYNALRHLRLHGDRKGQRRGLRVELVPGEPPRLVLEPWETVIPATAGPYKGKAARVVRVWGRRRLLLLQRFLPFVEEVDVHLLGSGLPSFWVLRGRRHDAHARPDRLHRGQLVAGPELRPAPAPQGRAGGEPLDAVLAPPRASAGRPAPASWRRRPGSTWPALTEALQLGCQQGQIMYDLAADVYRLRPLTDAPLDLAGWSSATAASGPPTTCWPAAGRSRSSRENRIAGTGLELTGKVTVAEDRREYRPQMLLADEGQVSRAECTCTVLPQAGAEGRAVRPPGRPAAGLRRAGGRRRLEGLDPRRGDHRRDPDLQPARRRRARTSTRSRSTASGSRSAGAGPASRCGSRR